MLSVHTRAILAQMSPEEQKVFERDPARSWLAQMRERLEAMSVADAIKLLRAEIHARPGTKSPPPAAQLTDREAKPESTTAGAPTHDR